MKNVRLALEILDSRNLPSRIGIIAGDATHLEGDSGTTSYTFHLLRDGDLSGSSSVTYSVTGSSSNPTSPGDFGGAFPSGTITFEAGATEKLVVVHVLGDPTDERNEQFTISLNSPVNTTLGISSAIGTIIDDDGPVLTVNQTADSGGGSLREVVAKAPEGARVTFNLPADSTITLVSGEIAIPAGRNLIIDATSTINLTLNGNNTSRIFQLNSTSVQPTSLVVRGMSLAHGNAGTGRGGAIGSTGELSLMVLDNLTLRDNRAAEGGALFSAYRGVLSISNSKFYRNDGTSSNSEQGGGAIFFFGPNGLTVRGSTFESNHGINGGAINNLAGRVDIADSVFRNNDVLVAQFAAGQPNDFLRGYGGALYSDRVSSATDATGGTYRIANSTFENNRARAAGGALYLYTGSLDALQIRDSVFMDNASVGLIGGESGNGGALELQSDTANRGLVIAGSTFARNRAVDRGGAVRMRNFPALFANNTFDDNRTTLTPTATFTGGLGGAIEMGGGAGILVTVRNNTFSNNFAAWTGGAILAGTTLRADNNIFDRNTTDTFANGNPILSHVDGSNISGSNNIQSTSNRGQSGNLAIPGGTITAEPNLAPLANNGGPTPTRALQTGSAAIDAGNDAAIPIDSFDADGDGNTLEATPFDQRGVGFGRIVGGRIDVGAFEFGNIPGIPLISVSGVLASQSEGNSGTTLFTFLVVRTGSTSSPSSVSYTLSGSGANPADVQDFVGGFPSGIINFATGETSHVISVAIHGDTIVEPTETFTLEIGNPFQASIGVTSATASILNDDAQSSTPGFRISRRYAVAGGQGSNGSVSVWDRDGSLTFTLQAFQAPPPGGVRTTMGDMTGDGIDDLIVGTGPGVSTQIRIFDGATQSLLFETAPFESSFTGGLFVAAGDVDGDGLADMIVSPDEGGGPRVQVYSSQRFTLLADFFGIEDPLFRGGARVSVADISGDGVGDLLVAAGFGGGPRLATFLGRSLGTAPIKAFPDFFVFEPTLFNGVYITGGDLDGDGFAEVIVGGGPGGGPRVFALSGVDLMAGREVQRANFFAGDVNDRAGVQVSIKQLDSDTRADLLTAAATGANPKVYTYSGITIPADGLPPTFRENANFDPSFAQGIYVG